MTAAFSKYEGLGNDFVVLAHADAGDLDASGAMALCDRHLGIGADGVLIVDAERPSMRVINADGTTPEMCGNGLRCVALHLQRQGQEGDEMSIETDAGPHRCRLLGRGNPVDVEACMAVASLAPAAMELDAPGPLIDAPFSLPSGTLRVTAVSMGNPHAVCFDEVGAARGRLGPELVAHRRFARGANASFATLISPERIELHVLERGVGWTRACGTAACATAVAAVETGRSPRHTPIAVQLPGGTLRIVVGAPDEPVAMTGPARHVFDGELESLTQPHVNK